MIYRLLLPLIFGTIAAGSAYGVKIWWAISDLQTGIVGSAVFCVLMVLWNHAAGVMFANRVRKRLASIVGFENDIIRRFEQLEKNLSTSVETEMVRRRVAELETRFDGLTRDRAGFPPNAIVPDFGNPVEYDDEKIVPFHGENRRSITARDNKKAAQAQLRQKCETAFAEGQLTIRLQPVINLMSRAAVAVEAFGFYRTDEGEISAREVGALLGDHERAEIDLRILEELAGIVRTMEDESQNLPVHFGFSAVAFADDQVWDRIKSRLRADARLASGIVPQIEAGQLAKLDEAVRVRFHELVELGLAPCVSQCLGARNIIALIESGRFRHFKIPAAELLAYTDREGERVADLVLPKIADKGYALVVSDVEKSHQLASLIDLDVSSAQGNIISPPREIKIYKDIPAASGDH
jgi:EAL domain-containing protein (putative c-di-GMP-specific phosphodiesterase class I)